MKYRDIIKNPNLYFSIIQKQSPPANADGLGRFNKKDYPDSLPGEEEDIVEIDKIFDQAKAYLKSKGIDQWQNGYPNAETILEDIKTDTSYVLIDNNQVIGTMRFLIDVDVDYINIEGKWLSDGEYGVIHRIAVADALKGKGYANVLLDKAIDLCKEYGVHSLRIDTHEMNLSMRSFLKKHGFVECGIVYIRKTDRRIAYELLI